MNKAEVKARLQKAWEEAFPDAAALEREAKRRWNLSYFDFLNLMEGRIVEARHIRIIRIVVLFCQLATLACQLWLSVWLMRLIRLL